MLDDLNPYEEYTTDVTTRVIDAQGIFGETLPYHVEHRLDGDVVVFNERFIKIVRRALTHGCLDSASVYESELIDDFIGYQDTGVTASRNNTSAGNLVLVLDQWIMNILSCSENSQSSECITIEDYSYRVCG